MTARLFIALALLATPVVAQPNIRVWYWLAIGLAIGSASTFAICAIVYIRLLRPLVQEHDTINLYSEAHMESLTSLYREEVEVRRQLDGAWEELARCRTREAILRQACKDNQVEVADLLEDVG